MEPWEERLDYYMKIGAIELAGMDDEGEFIFAITDKALEVAPELWEAHQDHVDKSLLTLYDMGLVTVEYDENLEATIGMSEEGMRLAKEFGIIQMDEDDIPND